MKLINKMNAFIQKKQTVNAIIAISVVVGLFFFIQGMDKEKPKKVKEMPNITGITNSEFTEKNTESALTTQQAELSDVEERLDQITELLKSLKDHQDSTKDDLKALAANQDGLMQRTDALEIQKAQPVRAGQVESMPSDAGQMVRISFRKSNAIQKNNDTYVPPGTYATAIILGGADADASVTGSNQQTPIIFKLLDNGKIPGGDHSKLKNCVVIASTYGDISSERALVRLKHITCKSGPNNTIDEEVEGWAWYKGKNGIKGVPLMRDDKVMAWAGISGMMAGFAEAMQYSQTTQSVSALGSTTTVNSDEVMQYGAYGGASTAMDNLSNYYIKRAEQYHPVIQVGAGNKVTIVFESGFFIVPHDKDNLEPQKNPATSVRIPKDILKQMENQSSVGQTIGVTP